MSLGRASMVKVKLKIQLGNKETIGVNSFRIAPTSFGTNFLEIELGKHCSGNILTEAKRPTENRTRHPSTVASR